MARRFNEPSKFRKGGPNHTSRARTVGYFSVDGDRNYIPNSSRLLYYNPPEGETVSLDLDEGIETAVRRTESFDHEGIALLLKWIEANHTKIKAPIDTDRWIQPNFVCSRGLLVKFFTAPYSPLQQWKIYAGKWKGTIYLRSDTQTKLFEIDDIRNARFASWGYKFQQYILSDSPDTAPDTSRPVIEPEEFRCVYLNKIGNYSLLFSTVMKGVCSKKLLKDPLPIHKLKFVDLKTSRLIEHAGHEQTLKKNKFLKWWTMGYLTNTESVLCGFRDDSGIVHKLNTYKLGQMVTMAEPHWHPAECIRCCQSFLKKLSETVINDCDETIYELTKVSHEDFDITELLPTEENEVLPKSYMVAIG